MFLDMVAMISAMIMVSVITGQQILINNSFGVTYITALYIFFGICLRIFGREIRFSKRLPGSF